MSTSITWFKTDAPAATRAVPTSAASSAPKRTGSAEEVTKPTRVVNTTIVVIRGLVSSTQSRTVTRLILRVRAVMICECVPARVASQRRLSSLAA